MDYFPALRWADIFEAASDLDKEHGTITTVTFDKPRTGEMPYYISVRLYDRAEMAGRDAVWEYRAGAPKGKKGAMEPVVMLAVQVAHQQLQDSPWHWTVEMRRRLGLGDG